MARYEELLASEADRDKHLEFESMLEGGADSRYSMPRRSRSYKLPSGQIIREDLGPGYRLFGTLDAMKIKYSIAEKSDEKLEDETTVEATYYEEYFVELDSLWGARIRFLSESHRSLDHYSGELMAWISSMEKL